MARLTPRPLPFLAAALAVAGLALVRPGLAQSPPSLLNRCSMRPMTNAALAAMPSGEVSPARTIPSAARTPSGSSPAPATTNVGGSDGSHGLAYEHP